MSAGEFGAKLYIYIYMCTQQAQGLKKIMVEVANYKTKSEINT